jgi:hypothetical protein
MAAWPPHALCVIVCPMQALAGTSLLRRVGAFEEAPQAGTLLLGQIEFPDGIHLDLHEFGVSIFESQVADVHASHDMGHTLHISKSDVGIQGAAVSHGVVSSTAYLLNSECGYRSLYLRTHLAAGTLYRHAPM